MKKWWRHRKTIIEITSYKDILKYTFPSILMMLFTALYWMVDGLLSSLYIGTDALSSINIVYPYLCLIVAIGVMIGTWWSANLAEKLWEGKEVEARKSFSQLIVFTILIGIILSVLSYIFAEPIVRFLWADGELYLNSYKYFKVVALFSVASLLQQVFQMLFITAWKPKTGLIITLFWGVMNIVLGYLFLAYFNLWVTWAWLASGIAWTLISIYGIVYFSEKNTALYFTKFKLKLKEFFSALENGCSEMVTDVSTSITTFFFNILMLKYFWNDGVAAATIILYFELFIYSIYIGFSNWIAPIESYYYWEKDYKSLRKLVLHNLKILAIASILLTAFAYWFWDFFIQWLSWSTDSVYTLASAWWLIFFTCFLFAWINIYVSSFFTSVWNDKISALISFLRSLVITSACLILFPMVFGAKSIWFAVPFAELVSILISCYYSKKYWKRYKL